MWMRINHEWKKNGFLQNKNSIEADKSMEIESFKMNVLFLEHIQKFQLTFTEMMQCICHVLFLW